MSVSSSGFMGLISVLHPGKRAEIHSIDATCMSRLGWDISINEYESSI